MGISTYKHLSRIKLVFLLTFLALGTTSCGIAPKDQAFSRPQISTPSDLDPSEPAQVNWAPKGFSKFDESIAFKFTTSKGQSPCSDCNYWKVTIIANEECKDGVYAELNMLDSSGTVLNWSNDSIPFLGARQKAVLTFENYPYDSNLDSGELTDLACY